MAIKNLGKVVPEKGVDYFTDEDIQSLNIPTKTSELTNDSSYVTETYVKNQIANAQLGGNGGEVDLSGYATKDELPTKTSDLTNDSGFMTSYTETDPTVPSHVKAITQDDINNWNNNSGNNSGNNSVSSDLLETIPANNLIDFDNLETSFVDKDGNTITGTFTNYIKLGLNKRYVTNLSYTQFYLFDENKTHLSTSTYINSPQVITGNGGYLLVKLGSNYSNVLFLEGTDIEAYKPAHSVLKSEYRNNKWFGKKWLCIGDSITTDTGIYATNGYAKLIARELGMTLTNIAVSGKVMKDGYDWLDECSTDFDLITVMLGTNNQGYNCALGSLNDEYYTAGTYDSNSSFYAQTQLMYEKLHAKYPKSIIIFITPVKRTSTSTEVSNNDEGYQINSLGFTTEKYKDVVIDVCNYYSVPYIDIFQTVDPRTESNRELYFMNVNDGTHPNDLAHALYIAPVIKDGILKQTPYYFNDWAVDNEPIIPDEPEEVYYSITRSLTNASSTSSLSTVKEGNSHTETVSANSGYTLNTVKVTMGGTDVTSSVYSDGVINITSVVGDVVITVTTTQESTGGEDVGEPVLLHSYSGTPVSVIYNDTEYTMLEDLSNNLDLLDNSYFNALHGVTPNNGKYSSDRKYNASDFIIEPDTSFSIKITNLNRKTNYFTQTSVFNTGAISGVNVTNYTETNRSRGRFHVDVVAPEGSTSVYGTGHTGLKYFSGNTTTMTQLRGAPKFANNETHNITITFDATSLKLKMYQDSELALDETLNTTLHFDGLCLANITSSGYMTFEKLEIYKGIIEDV